MDICTIELYAMERANCEGIEKLRWPVRRSHVKYIVIIVGIDHMHVLHVQGSLKGSIVFSTITRYTKICFGLTLQICTMNLIL